MFGREGGSEGEETNSQNHRQNERLTKNHAQGERSAHRENGAFRRWNYLFKCPSLIQDSWQATPFGHKEVNGGVKSQSATATNELRSLIEVPEIF